VFFVWLYHRSASWPHLGAPTSTMPCLESWRRCLAMACLSTWTGRGEGTRVQSNPLNSQKPYAVSIFNVSVAAVCPFGRLFFFSIYHRRWISSRLWVTYMYEFSLRIRFEVKINSYLHTCGFDYINPYQKKCPTSFL